MDAATKMEIIARYWHRRVAIPGTPYDTPHTVWLKFHDWRMGFTAMVSEWPQEQPSELEKGEKLDV